MSQQPSESFPLKLCICRETDGGSCEGGERGEKPVFANSRSIEDGEERKKKSAGKGEEEAENTPAVSKIMH